MEIQQQDKNISNSMKRKEKLSDSKLIEKITLAQQKIRDNIEVIKRFLHDLEPHSSPEFLKALKAISCQYSCILSYDVTLDDRSNLRIANAKTLISCGSIDILETILIQLFDGIFNLQCTEEINKCLYEATKRILFIFFNYTDASAAFGDEICKRDKLLSLYRNILTNTQESCLKGLIHENFVEILRTTIATLYNTLLHDSENNLQKIRQLNYLEIIKKFLSCNLERIKISSLLFTAYVANEGDSMLFKSDPESVTYLLNLLSESMRQKSGRAKGLSTEELAKGIEKLSKNDENKQQIVNLGVLPIIGKLMSKKIIKYKTLALSILWSLSFDERNRKLIVEMFLPLLTELKSSILKSERDKIDVFDENTVKKSTEKSLLDDFGHQILQISKEISGDVTYDGEQIIEDDEDEQYIRRVNTTMEKLKCSKVLDGLMWTLQGGLQETSIVDDNSQEINRESSQRDFIADVIPTFKRSMPCAPMKFARTSETLEVTKDVGHLMISYCWDNTEIVMSIYNALKELGYKLWIDKYNMAEKENLMESMANAVEKSLAVIICISNSYKDSANCRAEAQYAVTKKKPLIPVMVQPKYRPDGWLGFCITGLMYCDFKGSRSFDDAMKELSKQLNRISNGGKSEEKKPDLPKSKVDVTDHITKVTGSNESKKPNSEYEIIGWTNLQIKKWFSDIGIKKVTWKSEYTGQELSFLRLLSSLSPDTFFRISETKLDLKDLKDIRILYENIQKL